MPTNRVTYEFDFDKAVAALSYLASQSDKVPALTRYTAAKLLFLAEKYHLVRYGRPIFGGEYRALEHGPVPQDILDIIQSLTNANDSEDERITDLREVIEVDRKYVYPRLKLCGTVDLEPLSDSDQGAIDHILDLHGNKSFDELKAMTHEMFAYRSPWEARADGENMAIMHYEDFFQEDTDAVSGALEEMLEDFQIRKAITGA